MAATLTSFAMNGDGPMDEAHKVRVCSFVTSPCWSTVWLMDETSR